MTKGCQNFATRTEAGISRLVACIARAGKITTADAEKVAALYLSKKIRAAKIDPVGGSFTLAHGGFMESDVIAAALDGIQRAEAR